jgi:hypothetical protein
MRARHSAVSEERADKRRSGRLGDIDHDRLEAVCPERDHLGLATNDPDVVPHVLEVTDRARCVGHGDVDQVETSGARDVRDPRLDDDVEAVDRLADGRGPDLADELEPDGELVLAIEPRAEQRPGALAAIGVVVDPASDEGSVGARADGVDGDVLEVGKPVASIQSRDRARAVPPLLITHEVAFLGFGDVVVAPGQPSPTVTGRLVPRVAEPEQLVGVAQEPAARDVPESTLDASEELDLVGIRVGPRREARRFHLRARRRNRDLVVTATDTQDQHQAPHGPTLHDRRGRLASRR